MKIASPWKKVAAEAYADPQVGDYWSEHFCPYFLIVKIDGDDIYVLSAIGGKGFNHNNRQYEFNAKIEVGESKWTFDSSKVMIVDKDWITKTVKYSSIDDFVAECTRYGASHGFVTDWEKYVADNKVTDFYRLSEHLPTTVTTKVKSKFMHPRFVELARKAGFKYDTRDCNFYGSIDPDHINKMLMDLMESVIDDCASIVADAAMYKLPASSYPELLHNFNQLKESDYVVSLKPVVPKSDGSLDWSEP